MVERTDGTTTVQTAQFIRAILAAILLPVLAACSVGMALSGEKQPDLTVLKVGAAKHEIERELGPPEAETSQPDGSTQSTYHYEVGNEPSGGRAALHGAMDVLTLGLWELAGTPMEAMQGEEMALTVTYDSDAKARKFDIKKIEDQGKTKEGTAALSESTE